MLSPLEQMRVKYKKRRKEAGTREDSTMDKLARFTSSIRTTKKRAVGEDRKPEEVRALGSCIAFVGTTLTGESSSLKARGNTSLLVLSRLYPP